jgi:hypothetical protein
MYCAFQQQGVVAAISSYALTPYPFFFLSFVKRQVSDYQSGKKPRRNFEVKYDKMFTI